MKPVPALSACPPQQMSTAYNFEHVSPYSLEMITHSLAPVPSVKADGTLAFLFFFWIILNSTRTRPAIAPQEEPDLVAENARLREALRMAHGHQQLLEEDLEQSEYSEPEDLLNSVASALTQDGKTAQHLLANLADAYPELSKSKINSCLYKLLGNGLAIKTIPERGAPLWKAV